MPNLQYDSTNFDQLFREQIERHRQERRELEERQIAARQNNKAFKAAEELSTVQALASRTKVKQVKSPSEGYPLDPSRCPWGIVQVAWEGRTEFFARAPFIPARDTDQSLDGLLVLSPSPFSRSFTAFQPNPIVSQVVEKVWTRSTSPLRENDFSQKADFLLTPCYWLHPADRAEANAIKAIRSNRQIRGMGVLTPHYFWSQEWPRQVERLGLDSLAKFFRPKAELAIRLWDTHGESLPQDAEELVAEQRERNREMMLSLMGRAQSAERKAA